MTTITEKLRSVAATIRTKPTALSDFIPLLGQVADHIDKLEAEIDQLRAAPAAAPEQAFVCSLGCTDECVARAHGVPSECPSLPRQPATAPDELERLRWAIKDALEQLQRGDLADAESTLSDAAKGTP